jgi:phenylalanyl-tRNA synthetase beta chain
MKVSLNWLQDYVDLNGLSPETIAHRLTFAGIEVESLSPLAKGTFLTTGLVLTQTLVEGSKHLSVLTVDTGSHGVRTIVCGAPNVKPNQKVIVALPGAKLPSLTITESKIRGVVSQGMVCSLTELGVPNKFLTQEQIDGIEVLDASTPVGDDHILDHLGLSDYILDFKVLAIRPDLLSVYGIAFELGALFDRPVKSWKTVPLPTAIDSSIKLSIQHEGCDRFVLQEIHGLKPIQTPSWMVRRLMGSGVRSIHFLVDIGNYVMLLTGQPLHMYDMKKLPKQELNIGHYQGAFKALDDKEYTLTHDDIAIMSQNEVMCLAGVMGSAQCEVDASTTDIAIEAASFKGSTIRKTALRLDLISDSSQRFSKGLIPNLEEDALALTTSLIHSLTSFKQLSSPQVIGSKQTRLISIPFTYNGINRLLGTSFSNELILTTLTRMGITIVEGATLIAHVPPHRLDMMHQADLAEEVVRIIGFETVISTLPNLQPTMTGLTDNQRKKRLLKEMLRGSGLSEVLTYTLTDEKTLNSFQWLSALNPIAIKNPLTNDRQWIRTNLLGSLIETALYNVNHQNKSLALFEVSDVYGLNQQQLRLSLLLTGSRPSQGLLGSVSYDFYDLKGIIEKILHAFNIDSNRAFFVPAELFVEERHPGRSANVLIGNQRWGVFSELSPTKSAALGFGKQTVLAGEFDLNILFDTKVSPLKLAPINKFPKVERDFAFILSQDIDYASIQKVIRRSSKEVISHVDIFDVYEGASIAKGQRSVAVKVTFESLSKTMTDAEIQYLVERIKIDLQKNFQVTFRI